MSDDKLALLRAEIANVDSEIEVETRRRQLLEADIASHVERAKLLADATVNAESEMRLHKIAAGVWQGKIKVIRDETKVREARIRVLEDEIARLKDLKGVRYQTLGMIEALRVNYDQALAMNREELDCLERQQRFQQARMSHSQPI
eukprot:c6186_g1_i1.p1 GENE.c6186_g1_i1~~c6186_g1_i1.p1  ORF type:complete len:160 (+),score=49.65 c6186_g1_i1:44-481(+)